MECILLGTGTSQGIPVIGCKCPVCTSIDIRDSRLRVSCFIDDEESNQKILIDIGPDFRQQMLSNQISDIDAVLLTHEHNDHTAGLDDIRAINFLHNKNIPFYGLDRVITDIKNRFHYALSTNKYPGVPQIEMHTVEREIQLGSLKIIPIPIMHGTLPILGYRIKNFAYLTDASLITKESLEKLKDLDVLVINALRQKKHYSHFTLEEALIEIEKIRPKKTYLTHISHVFDTHENITKLLPDNVCVAYDGLRLSL